MNATRPAVAMRFAGLGEYGEGDPPPPAGKDDIYVSLQLNKLKSVDVIKRTFTLEVWIRYIWNDPRLAYDDTCLQTNLIDSVGFTAGFMPSIWTPDLYSKSEASKPVVANSAFWVSPSGRVWKLDKIFHTLSCPLDYRMMPYDHHTCNITIAGFTPDASEIKLSFPNGSSYFEGLNSPVNYICMKGGSVEFQPISITGYQNQATYGQSVVPETSMTYVFVFQRLPGFYISYRLTPMILVVIISYLSFWTSRGAVPARIALVVISFLALTNMINALVLDLPRSHEYVWLLSLMQGSMYFILIATIEYALINYLGRVEARIKRAVAAVGKKAEDSKKADVEDVATSTNTVTVSVQSAEETLHRDVRKHLGPVSRRFVRPYRAGRPPTVIVSDDQVDICCRIFYLPIFAIMVIVFLVQLPPLQESLLEHLVQCEGIGQEPNHAGSG